MRAALRLAAAVSVAAVLSGCAPMLLLPLNDGIAAIGRMVEDRPADLTASAPPESN